MSRLRLDSQNKSLQEGRWDAETSCSEKLWMLYPWKCTGPRWGVFEQPGVVGGIDDFWRYHPTQSALWCYDWTAVVINDFLKLKLVYIFLINSCKKQCFIHAFFPFWKHEMHLNILLFFLVRREYGEKITWGVFFCSAFGILLVFILALNW